jgi:transposase-like protein
MKKDNIINYQNPTQNLVTDALSDFLRSSAQKMLQLAIEEEVQNFITSYQDKLLTNGNKQIVRNGYLPERNIQTGIGEMTVKVPRVRDRGKDNISFTSNLIPQYMRRTVTIDVLLPLLYLKGISTTDFADSFEPILGSRPKNLSPNVISRLKAGWHDQYLSWQQRDLSKKKYVYFWADGVYLQARMESEKNCILVIVGADEHGKKEVVAIDDGFRESKESWRGLLLDLKSRGLKQAPKLAVGDGALGFWGALTEEYPDTVQQRCWVHKTSNILNKLPKSQQAKAKQMIHNIYLSASREEAETAWKKFISAYSAKYPKTTECLAKSEKELLAFYDFPAEHWIHLRTTNPIESTFATVKHRTRKSRNCFSRNTIIAATYKLFLEAERRWKPLRGKNRIAQVINMEKFIDGIHENEISNDNLIEKKYVA